MNYQKLRKTLLNIAITTGLLSSLTTNVKAQETFSNDHIRFNQDTVVEFEFIRSHGSYLATFGIKNETTGVETILFQEIKPYDSYGNPIQQTTDPGANNTNESIDYTGTIGKSVIPGDDVNIVSYNNKPDGSVVEFNFEEDQEYSFFLESVSPTGQTSRKLISTQNYAQFDGDLEGGNSSDRYGRNIVGSSVSWEDGGEITEGNDFDYDDFVIEIGGFLRTYCPPIR